jgi:hypothetical protein
MMAGGPARDAFKLTFQLSPIILTGGVAALIPGGMLPIISITESLSFPLGLLSGGSSDLGLDDFFANFEPIPGGTLEDQQIGTYPFANQQVAANAVIRQPLSISMIMICPVRPNVGYLTKIATMTALKSVLDQHNSTGGTYTVSTPANFYDNCLMTKMTDVSSGQSKQVQDRFRLDFVQPLLTLQAAQAAQNNLMGQISGGTMVSGDPPAWSAPPPTVGAPSSLAGVSAVPALSSPSGASVASPTPSGP